MDSNNDFIEFIKIKNYEKNSYFGAMINGKGCKELPEFNKNLAYQLYNSGFIIMKNFNVDENKVIDWFLNIAQPVSYSFGKVLSMQIKKDSPESQFSNKPMAIHQDTIINNSKKATLLSFYCVKAPLNGGETLLCNNRMFLKIIDKELYNTLKSSKIFYKANSTNYYQGDGKALQSPIVKHPITKEEIIFMGLNDSLDPGRNYTSYFENINFDDSEILMKKIDNYFRSSKVMYSHKWENGDILLLDNFLVSHGRNGFNEGEERKLLRVSSIMTYPSEVLLGNN